MEKLTLEQITPYIPYRVKGFNSIGKIVEFTLSDGRYHLDKGFTPILRPMEQLTQQIQVFYDTFSEVFTPVGYLIKNADRYNVKFDKTDDDFELWFEHKKSGDVAEFDMTYETVRKLFEWHFDVFGLIEKGLAKNILELSPKHLKEVQK